MKTKRATYKNCIYLDQFAVSDMIESNKGDIWFEIKNTLVERYKKGHLFCPMSYEHFIETSQKDFENAKTHDLFLFDLSDGYCLKPEVFITSQLISSRIRKNRITINTFMYEGINQTLNQESKYNSFGKVNDDFKYLISNAANNLNDLRHLTNGQKIDSSTRTLLLNTIKKQQTFSFIKRLKELKAKNGIIIRGDVIGNKEVANWIDIIIDQLIKKHRFTKKEIDKLISEFEINGFQNIATLDIRMTIGAYLSIHSKKETSNDHLDILRISTGLPFSTILLTDKQRKSELIESGLAEKYKTKVFSGTKSDLKLLLIELKKPHT